MNHNELQKEIIKKAASDASFRDAIIKNPKETIEKAFGFTVPMNFVIKIVEEDADTVSFVLPKDKNELSDSALDKVAGGFFDCGSNCYDCGLCIKDLF